MKLESDSIERTLNFVYTFTKVHVTVNDETMLQFMTESFNFIYTFRKVHTTVVLYDPL